MLKINILKLLYKRSPMNFYTRTQDNKTIIKSINNTSLGYEFCKDFNENEVNIVWDKIKLYKRKSTIFIFFLFLALLYGVIFPNFYQLVNNYWYINTIIFLAVIIIAYYIITVIFTKIFEKEIQKQFGDFKKANFYISDMIDENYYNLFKIELTKALVLILTILLCFNIGSPFIITQNLIMKKKYNEAIKLTTIGSKIFPIAQEWYELRGFSKFQLKDYEGAIKDYDKAYQLGADGFNIMNFDNKIFIKYFLKDYEGALKDFDKEISNADSDYEKDSFLWDKAQFLYNIKHYEEALVLYTELLTKAENDRIFLLKDRLYLERAEVYKKLGLDDLAKQDIINSGTWDQNENTTDPIPKPVLIYNEI